MCGSKKMWNQIFSTHMQMSTQLNVNYFPFMGNISVVKILWIILYMSCIVIFYHDLAGALRLS